jgi:ribosomal protein L29
MINMSDIRKKTDTELVELVEKARETVRAERFKDKFSRKANIIVGAKKEIARLLTELTVRRSNGNTK